MDKGDVRLTDMDTAGCSGLVRLRRECPYLYTAVTGKA